MTEPSRGRVDDAGLDALLTRAARGDREAFAAFYDATAAHVYGALVELVGDEARARSALEDAYVEVWERLPGRDTPPCPGRAWVSLIARRRVAQ